MNSLGEYLVKHRSNLQWLCSQLQTCRKGQRTSLLTIPQKSCSCRKRMENCASLRNQELTCLNWAWMSLGVSRVDSKEEGSSSALQSCGRGAEFSTSAQPLRKLRLFPGGFLFSEVVFWILYLCLTFPPPLPNIVCFSPIRLTIGKHVEKFKFLTFWSCSQLCWCFSLTAPLSNRNRSCLIPSRPRQRDYMCKRHQNRAENPRLMLSKKIPSALWVLLAGYSSALVVVSFQWL